MAPRSWLMLLVVGLLGLSMGYEVAAKEPIFVRWLVMDDPGDATIMVYWERYTKEELAPSEKVDLGTMLFYRGYPKDAVGVFQSALDDDKEMYEAWFRIGLVEHQQGNLRKARIAYKHCLDILKGHGWCNFYLGLLEEQEGHSKEAMRYYERAFRVAPELANPNVNPEVQSSNLSLGAWLKMTHEWAFKNDLPMPFLEPEEVEKTQSAAMQLYGADGGRQIGDLTGDSAGAQPTPAAPDQPEGRAAPAETSPPGSGPQPFRPANANKNGSTSTGPNPTDETQANHSRTTKPPSPRPSPTPAVENDVPYGGPTTDEDLPYGLPSTRGVSPEAYPGF